MPVMGSRNIKHAWQYGWPPWTIPDNSGLCMCPHKNVVKYCWIKSMVNQLHTLGQKKCMRVSHKHPHLLYPKYRTLSELRTQNAEIIYSAIHNTTNFHIQLLPNIMGQGDPPLRHKYVTGMGATQMRNPYAHVYVIFYIGMCIYIIYGWQKTRTLIQYIILQQIRSCEMKIYCMRLDEGEPWMCIGLHESQ